MSASETVRSVTDLFDRFAPIGLGEVAAVADLQERYDTKYVIALERLEQLVTALDERVEILEVASRRATSYRTTYFDTPDLATYRAHVQRRRRRYKIRTRSYDAQLTMLEVKTKDKAGRTIKHRRLHPGTAPHVLPSEAVAYVADRLYEAYGFALPGELAVSAVTDYLRTTLVDAVAGERITVDADLRVEQGERAVAFHPGYVLVETKAPTRTGNADRLLRRLGARPVRVSKYGVGIAVLHPHLPSNLWRPVLRKLGPDA